MEVFSLGTLSNWAIFQQTMFDCRTLFPMPCGPAGIFGRLLFEWKNMVWILYASVVVHGTFVADLVITPSQTLSMGECTGSPLYTIIIHTFPEKSQGQNTPCFLGRFLFNQSIEQSERDSMPQWPWKKRSISRSISKDMNAAVLQMHHGRLQT